MNTASALDGGALAEPLLSAEQVAELLGVSERYVWRLGRDGELPRVNVGRYVRFDPADLRAFIEQRKQRGRGSRATLSEPSERRPSATTRRRF